MLPRYVALFTAGILAHRGDWSRRPPDRAGVAGAVTAAVALPLMLVWGITTPGTAQALAQVLAEHLFSVGVMPALLVFFRRRVSREQRVWRFLSDHAFAVYVLHTPELVGLGAALGGWEAAAVVEFAALAALAVPLTWAPAYGVRALPGLRRVL
ncbi:acyltransferase family protein [Nocardiopsis sp. MG754419]|uniref:acyltransferase family protein n=1 Tax=Nocardiopsis sp. MG754419 TaxID=2259865 RepID=UPI002013A1BD|nr:acyltransferase family protein [Nocardiopsis sp. MG754419]